MIPVADIEVKDKTTGTTTNLTGSGEGCTKIQIDCSHDYEVTANKKPYCSKTVSLRNLLSEADCKKAGEHRIEVELKQPVVVMLEPIFFDFDRYYIRKKDAKGTLDSLAMIMEKYPSLNVKLVGNCDSRGSKAYNITLGNNRADSAKKYLVQKGIAEDRITTGNNGEEGLVNNCTDDVYCPPIQHQYNRRVDVVADGFQECGFEFRTRDLKEMDIKSDVNF